MTMVGGLSCHTNLQKSMIVSGLGPTWVHSMHGQGRVTDRALQTLPCVAMNSRVFMYPYNTTQIRIHM